MGAAYEENLDTEPRTRDHGTYACYVKDRCRCEDCRRACRDYDRTRRRLKAYGRTPWVDPTPAREHLLSLLSGVVGRTGGVSLKRMAAVSGVSHGALWRLLYGENGRPSGRIHRDTEERILSVGPTDAAPGATVSAGWTWRMIDELNSLGMATSAIASALGCSQPRLRLSRKRVRVKTAKAVEALHWNVWRTSPELRKVCACPPPRELVRELAPQAVA